MTRRRLSLMERAFAVLFFCFSFQVSAAQLRGLWVDSWNPGFATPDQSSRLIADCRRYNFNAIFVQVRRRGDAFYVPSGGNLDPRTTAVSVGYDCLADLIAKAHSGSPRVEVHCWFVSNLIWSGNVAPTQPSHVFNRHPEFLTKTYQGKVAYPEGFYLDPGNVAAMQWNFTAATNIVSRYDIDGFHWDYIRYPGADSGYNESALARYQAESGSKERPLPTDPRFADWRRRQVTDFLRWANADLLKLKPGLIISAAVFASRTDAFSTRFQDWGNWLGTGIVDACIPMNYSPDNALFRQRLEDAARNQGARRIYMGLGAYLNTKENTVAQYVAASNKGLRGFNIYSYGSMERGGANHDRVMAFLKKKCQISWTSTPDYPWKKKYGILAGSASIDGAPVYNAKVAIRSSSQIEQRTGAHGKFAFYDLPPGNYTATVSTGDKTLTMGPITIGPGRVEKTDFKFSSQPPAGPVPPRSN